MRVVLLSLALIVGFLSAGCSAPAGNGSASVYVQDAATDEFDEVHVVFTEVRVHAAGGHDDANETDSSSHDDNSTAGWKTLFSDSAGVDIDLLNVTGTRAAFLGEESLAVGKYTQLRIIVTRAYGIQDGNEVPITVSSGTLKFNHPFEVAAGLETRLVIDVDLDRSLRQTGGPSGDWRMTPVIGSVAAKIVQDDSSGADTAEAGDVETVAP